MKDKKDFLNDNAGEDMNLVSDSQQAEGQAAGSQIFATQTNSVSAGEDSQQAIVGDDAVTANGAGGANDVEEAEVANEAEAAHGESENGRQIERNLSEIEKFEEAVPAFFLARGDILETENVDEIIKELDAFVKYYPLFVWTKESRKKLFEKAAKNEKFCLWCLNNDCTFFTEMKTSEKRAFLAEQSKLCHDNVCLFCLSSNPSLFEALSDKEKVEFLIDNLKNDRTTLWILKQQPQLARCQFSAGNTVLHVWAQYKAFEPLLEEFLKDHPDALWDENGQFIRNANGETVASLAATNGLSGLCMQLLQSDDFAKNFSAECQQIAQEKRLKNTFVHVALNSARWNDTEKLANFLSFAVERCPEVALVLDANGKTLLQELQQKQAEIEKLFGAKNSELSKVIDELGAGIILKDGTEDNAENADKADNAANSCKPAEQTKSDSPTTGIKTVQNGENTNQKR